MLESPLGGIKNEDREITEVCLRKLYTIGMIIASAFTIHSHPRIDITTIDTLASAFVILQQLKEKLGIEMPEIFLLVRDAREILMKGGSGPSVLLERIKTATKLNEIILQKLKPLPRPPPPEEYLKSGDPAYLFGTDLDSFNRELIKQLSVLPKKSLAKNSYLTIGNFKELLTLLDSSINSDNFEQYFKGTLESTVASIISPLKEKYIE